MSKSRAAFSLVEMLIAVILITLLIGVAVFAFKYQLLAIHQTKKIAINKILIYNQLKSSLESIKYYIVDDYDTLGYPMKNLHPYFNGTNNEINFITQNPIFSKDVSLSRLKCENKELVYREEKLYGTMDFLRPLLKDDVKKTIFYKDLANCSFSYLLEHKNYDALNDEIPSSIVINLTYKESKHQIYVNIKSDYNQSIRIINNAIYPVE